METFDPLNTFKKLSNQWEQQANDFFQTMTNNDEFVKFSRAGISTQARFMEMLTKNQEFIANQLNLPTKKDIARVAKLSIQTDEKLDSLEEQIWNLQDSVDALNKERASVIEVSSDITKLSKQLKTDMAKTQKELTATKELRVELEGIKDEFSQISSLKEEISLLRELLAEKLIENAASKKDSLPEQGESK